MNTNKILQICKREFCRNHMKLIPDVEKREERYYRYFVSLPCIIFFIGFYLMAFKENIIINGVGVLALAIVMSLVSVLEKRCITKKEANFPYKKEYDISYLWFSVISLICIYGGIALMYTKMDFGEDVFKRTSLLLILVALFVIFVKHILFSLIPTARELSDRNDK